MERQGEDGKRYDRETDPAVIAKRHELFNRLVMPSRRFIDYLCVKYCSDPKDITEFKYHCMAHLYRVIESFDASKYKETNEARAWQNWCHIVCKRHIQSMEEDRYKDECRRSEHLDIEDATIWDGDDVAMDTENTNVFITMSNYKQLMGDRLLYAFGHLDIIQQESFLLQHEGMTIAEIHKDQVEKGRISPNTGCDAIKKRMQRGRVILAKYMQEFDEFEKQRLESEDEVVVPGDSQEDEFSLHF